MTVPVTSPAGGAPLTAPAPPAAVPLFEFEPVAELVTQPLAIGPVVAHLEVLGDPAPQGSKTRMPNGAVIEGASAAQRVKHANWRGALAAAARDAADGRAPLDEPLGLFIEIRTRMPASRRAVERRRGMGWKASAPDADKLLRTICDGLEAGGLVRNDARFAFVAVSKVELVDGWTGADITLRSLT